MLPHQRRSLNPSQRLLVILTALLLAAAPLQTTASAASDPSATAQGQAVTTQTLIEQLADSDSDRQQQAAEALIGLGKDQALPEILASLKHQNQEIRYQAIQILQQWERSSQPDARIHAAVLALVQDPDTSIRSSVSEFSCSLAKIAAFHDLSESVRQIDYVAALIPQLESADLTRHASAVQGLACWKDTRARPALMKALRAPDPNLRSLTIGSIRDWEDPSFSQALIASSRDSDLIVREQAIQALDKLPGKAVSEALIAALADQDLSLTALYALNGRNDPTAIPALLKQLQAAEINARVYAASSLRAFQTPAVIQALIRATRDADPNVRLAAISSLGTLGGPRAQAELLSILKSPIAAGQQPGSLLDHEQAAGVMSNLPAEAVGPALVKTLSSQHANLRNAAAQSLGTLGYRPAVPALLKLVQHAESTQISDQMDQRALVESLGKIGDRSATPVLCRLLISSLDKDKVLSMVMISALGELEDPTALPALLQVLERNDDSLNDRLSETLSSLKDPAVIPALQRLSQNPEPYIAWPAKGGLIANGDRKALLALLSDLQDRDPEIRELSLIYLAESKAPAVSQALLESVRDASALVRIRAALVLSARQEPTTLPALIRLLHDPVPGVRITAASALESLGDRRALAPLKAALTDQNIEVHNQISHAIAELEKS